MKLYFDLYDQQNSTQRIEINATHGLIAGWAGRDQAANEAHIQELAELGVPRPSSIPLFYEVGCNHFVQDSSIQVVGPHSSGEAEVLLMRHQDDYLISLASDHTDRKLEAHSVALSKQVCPKPVARNAWYFSDIEAHWDELILKSWIIEDGQQVLYQDAPLSSLLLPMDLVEKRFPGAKLPESTLMTCGTVPAIGGIRPAPTFIMQLFDPVLNRHLEHQYQMEILPEIA